MTIGKGHDSVQKAGEKMLISQRKITILAVSLSACVVFAGCGFIKGLFAPDPPSTPIPPTSNTTPATPPPSQANTAAPPANPANTTAAPANGGNTGAIKGSLPDDQMVLAQISYGASIDAVKQAYGMPSEYDQEHKAGVNGMVEEYEYNHAFKVWAVNGVVQRIKVDHLNNYATSKGISVGSTSSSVQEAYGQPDIMTNDRYVYRSASNPQLGLSFELEFGLVEEIVCGNLTLD